MEEPKTNEDEFALESIGLCFSGGGYRATSFTLGVLSYLDKIQYKKESLLSKVIIISSVSGGSITAGTYAASASKSENFSAYYNRIYKFLKDDKLAEKALEIFTNEKEWVNTDRSRTLINAFSKVYEKYLISDSFDILKKEKLANSSLKYLCLNTTELSRGIAFRFQNFNVFGNYHYKVDKKLRGKILIADAIAASSCFPLAFEPKVFPHDFFDDHNFSSFQDYLSKINPETGIGLMDGGIVDNQGIGSVINAIKSTSNKIPIDLLIINDVGSSDMKKWVSSGINKPNVFFKLIFASPDFFKTVLSALMVNLCFVNVIYLFYKYCSSQFEFGVRTFANLFDFSLVLFGVLSSLSAISLIFSVKLRKCFRNLKEKHHESFPKSIWTLPKSLSQFPSVDLQKSTMDRVSSFSLILNEIFLRQLRRLNLQFVYKNEVLKNKLITSTVYQLSSDRNKIDFALENNEEPLPFPQSIKNVADISSSMRTALWWSKEDVSLNRLDNLIACGQFTTCYNLILFLSKFNSERKDSDILELEEKLRRDWEQFKQNPLFYL